MAISILSKVALRNLFSRAPTRRYPEEPRVPFPLSRGHVSFSPEKCNFCGLCQRKCPTHAILVTKPDQSWSIDRLKCIACAACFDACVKRCITVQGHTIPPYLTGKKEESIETERKTVAIPAK